LLGNNSRAKNKLLPEIKDLKSTGVASRARRLLEVFFFARLNLVRVSPLSFSY
jgi:hypothetical protein